MVRAVIKPKIRYFFRQSIIFECFVCGFLIKTLVFKSLFLYIIMNEIKISMNIYV